MSNSLEFLKGKKVVVVGGSSGIGFAVAAAALAHGATVVVSSSSETRVADAVKRLGGGADKSVSGIAVDVRDDAKLCAFLDNVGPFDHLIWTAADRLVGGYPNVAIPQSKHIFDINFWAPALAGKHIHKKGLILPGGSITLTSGVAYIKPTKSWAITSGAAGARVSLAKGMAVDLAPIRVNVISPGAVDTELWGAIDPTEKGRLLAQIAQVQLVKRIANPEEIAEAYVFAMKCSYFTGQVIEVDGGAVLG
ncbi:hypothetical protein BOTBODRAFT_32010 [Botryobasidium botryosum FD-172 SS1]|uniref:Uncharacterized protein n=1 Tax=Botryobasidium botryosum (strain FD-172 SS1) TaxID=930990 RepID=A0A067MHK0_BOTB1|nr:hypothetical protein BOTBODRAFT_32010 [Botryobasidium botryosum FD-172 SS1]